MGRREERWAPPEKRESLSTDSSVKREGCVSERIVVWFLLLGIKQQNTQEVFQSIALLLELQALYFLRLELTSEPPHSTCRKEGRKLGRREG